MFREMRKKERALDGEAAKIILEKGEYGVLATVEENGYPYTVPLSYVYHAGAIYFHCATEGSKLDSIRRDSRVSFCVVGNTCILPEKFSTRYESVVLFGRAVPAEGQEKEEALQCLIEKYSPDFIKEGKEYIDRAFAYTMVVKIQIEYITAKGRR